VLADKTEKTEHQQGTNGVKGEGGNKNEKDCLIKLMTAKKTQTRNPFARGTSRRLGT